MPSLDSTHMQNELIAAAVRSTVIPGVFPLHALANGDITVPPPGSVDVGMGMYPSSMCGSGAFDDALQHLGENPDTFMSNPTVEQLVATINTLSESPQPQGDVSPDSESVDPTQAFNLDDFVKDFGAPASQECESFDLVGEQNITTTLSVVSRNSPATSSSHSEESVASPMPSFYVSLSSPAPMQPTPAPTPPLAKPSHIAPRGATNNGTRRVGGTWKVPWPFRESHPPFPVVLPLPIRWWRKNPPLSVSLFDLAPLLIRHDFLLSHNTCIASFDTHILSLRHFAAFVVISSLSYAFPSTFLFSPIYPYKSTLTRTPHALISYCLTSPIPPSIHPSIIETLQGLAWPMSFAGNFGAQHDVICRRMVPLFRLSVSRVILRRCLCPYS
ncbi:hypothetical protein BGY98DRAFT_386119 [Russula aff. rugulosa BPL654]|nr:hypothetical protein BGY98DRAFT_386119 [Russula aff. rugulosa BPL654]